MPVGLYTFVNFVVFNVIVILYREPVKPCTYCVKGHSCLSLIYCNRLHFHYRISLLKPYGWRSFQHPSSIHLVGITSKCKHQGAYRGADYILPLFRITCVPNCSDRKIVSIIGYNCHFYVGCEAAPALSLAFSTTPCSSGLIPAILSLSII